VTLGLVNLHDSTVVQLNAGTTVARLLREAKRKLTQLLPAAAGVAAAAAAGTGTSASGHGDGATLEARLTARCWAVHDACLLDASSPTSTSPSCPDHTALNSPPLSSADASLDSSSVRVSQVVTVVAEG